jgi:hypothetical protein
MHSAVTRIGVISTIFAVALSGAMAGQKNDEWPPLSYLRSDYRRVSVVVRVRATDAEIVNRIGDYEDWHIVGEVIEPFKGKFRKGDRIEYYHGAEAGFRKELFLGDQIIFLERNFVQKEKRWVFAVLENSTLPYTKDRIDKLRSIARATKNTTKSKSTRK